ncbi:MAG: hypothetical protein IPJ98_26885 [Bryobacterales bacterium]|nr:hypothetical protein [Bryobacterales bacterium]
MRNGEAIDYDKSAAFPAAESGLIHVQPKNPRTDAERALREKNMEATLHALSAATDPGTKRRAFTVVLPWEDAAPFGLYGPRHADILALGPGAAGGSRGATWPLTAGWGEYVEGMYLFWGARARGGFREAGPVWPEDIAPTAAYVLGIGPPAESSGRVLHRMLR